MSVSRIRFGRSIPRALASVWAVVALAMTALSCSFAAANAEEALSSGDFAEVYVDRYFGPDEKLELKEAGVRRAEALAHYSRGLSLEASDQIDEAVVAFRKVLAISPSEVGLARKVAYLLAQTGNREEGRKVLETAYRNHSKSPLAAIVLSEYLATFLADNEETRAEAMRLAEEAVERFPSYPNSWEHLVKMHLATRQIGKAREAVTQAIERDEPNPLFWIRLGSVAQRIWPLNPDEQSPDVINGIFAKAFERGRDNPMVRERVGDYYHDSRQPDKALVVFQDLVKDFPDHLEIREKLARVYGAMGKEDEVIATLEEIVEINSQDAEVHRELGRLYVGREDYAKATAHFREAMRLTSGTAEEYEAIGRMIIFGAQMAEDGMTFLERGAYLHPEDPRLPFLLTFAAAQLDRFPEAVTWFEKTVELASQSQPDLLDGVFYYRFGASVERAGDIKRASDLFRTSMEQLAKLDSDDEQTRGLRAEVYNYLGYMWLENDMNIDEAGELIKEALSLVPESGAVTDSLGWYYFKKGKYEEAKRELLKAEQMIEKPDGVIYDHLAQTLFKLGERDRALDLMRKAVELEPDKAEFKDRLKEYEASEPTEAKPKASTPSESPEPSTDGEKKEAPPAPAAPAAAPKAA